MKNILNYTETGGIFNYISSWLVNPFFSLISCAHACSPLLSRILNESRMRRVTQVM